MTIQSSFFTGGQTKIQRPKSKIRNSFFTVDNTIKDEEYGKFNNQNINQNVSNVGNFMDQVVTPKVDQLKSNIDFQDNITF